MSDIIEVKNLSFNYGNNLIFSNIDFSIHQGDFTAIIGSNGAGKSTLMKLLLGELVSPTGSIRLFAQDIRQFRGWPKIGYVPQTGLQSLSNFPATASEIVKANLYSKIGAFRFPRKEHNEKTQQTLDLVGMGTYSKRLISELSGGQQQRVMLARVLVNDPDVMLLDEPSTGVDSQAVQALYQLLHKLNKEKGITIVMITHDVAKVSNYASRILCLEEGSLVELDKTQLHEELSHKHKHPAKANQWPQQKGDE